jgi:hypothetical protein
MGGEFGVCIHSNILLAFLCFNLILSYTYSPAEFPVPLHLIRYLTGIIQSPIEKERAVIKHKITALDPSP